MTEPTTACPRCWGARLEVPCVLCDGRGEIRDPALSAHFKYSELVHTAHRRFANDPGPDEIGHLRRLCGELLEPVRARVGALRVTSGYRSPVLDAHVAGDPQWLTRRSAHSIGAAADVVPVAWGVSLQVVVEAVLACGAAWDQIILEGGCAHLGLLAPYGADRQRRQVLVRMGAPAWLAWHVAGAPRGQEPQRFLYAPYTGTPEQLALVA